MVRGFIRSAIAALIAATAVCGKADADPLQFKNLTLTDGWVRYDTTVGKPSVAVDPDNIVHLRGALHQATDIRREADAYAYKVLQKLREQISQVAQTVDRGLSELETRHAHDDVIERATNRA